MQPDDDEIQELSDFFHGWCVAPVQLGPRQARTLVSHAAFGSHRILRLEAGSALALRGSVHQGCSSAWLSASPQTPVRFLGQALRADALMLAGPGACIDLFVPAGAELCILIAESSTSVPRRDLRTCAATAFQAPGVARLARYLRNPQQYRREPTAAVMNGLEQAVTASRIVRPASSGCAARVTAVVSACQLIEKSFPAPVTLNDLCQHCGVAERTLEYGFQQVYDTTPLAFVRSQRLTRSRLALLQATGASVSGTARAHGFKHMGQFSSDYRRIFGETPSDTLARGRRTATTLALALALVLP